MKIIYHHRIASKDGQFTHIEEMVHAMRELGHEVLLVGPTVLDKDSGGGGSAGWVGRLKSLLPAALYEISELVYSLFVYRRLDQAVRLFQPDFIYERYALYQPAGVWVSWRSGLPLLLEVNSPYAVQRKLHDGLKLARLAGWVEKYTITRADKVFPVSAVLGRTLAQMGVPDDRIVVVPNAINPSHFADLPSMEQIKIRYGIKEKIVVGFIGFVRDWDRLDLILDWLAGIQDQSRPVLMVVGDGPARGSLEAQARRLGIADSLIFTGVVNRDQVPAMAMAFDVALQSNLLPYISPLCLFEYMALGKAIVAPDQPNHHELLRDGSDALLFRPGDTSDMIGKIEILVGDGALRGRIGEGAKATLNRRNFYWTGNARRVTDAVEGLMAIGKVDSRNPRQ
jgi:glycosyltransferase involved in cell wall biosynthesis